MTGIAAAVSDDDDYYYYLDFAVEHWFDCRASEPGFAADIGAIEVWLIDWYYYYYYYYYDNDRDADDQDDEDDDDGALSNCLTTPLYPY